MLLKIETNKCVANVGTCTFANFMAENQNSMCTTNIAPLNLYGVFWLVYVILFTYVWVQKYCSGCKKKLQLLPFLLSQITVSSSCSRLQQLLFAAAEHPQF
jgi:hypothetical protein